MAVDWTNVAWCPDYGNGIVTTPFSIPEGTYYNAMTSALPTFLLFGANSGCQATAKSMYPNAHFSSDELKFNSECTPELNTRSRLGYPGFNGELKSWDTNMFEEVVQYVTIAMLDSYFSQETYPLRTVFYSSPPCGYGIVGYGPCGMLISVEMIGALYYSFISKPFFLGSQDHISAIDMVNARHTEPQSPSFFVPHSHKSYFTNMDKCKVKFSLLKTDNNELLFFKIVPCVIFYSENAPKQNKKQYDQNSITSVIGENSCQNCQWNDTTIFFYHMYRVYKKLEILNSAGMQHHASYVPCRLHYGRMEVCITSPAVGNRDATMQDFENDEEVISKIVEFVYWLARSTGLLYIDMRPPNIRLTISDINNTSTHVYVIDYDDCVILENNSTDDETTFHLLCQNEYVQKVFKIFPNLKATFEGKVLHMYYITQELFQ
jgi:hypothetical protein